MPHLSLGAPLAAAPIRTTFQWGRIHTPEDWWLPLALSALILAYVWWLYRRDSVELRRPVAWLLIGLRTAALLGLLFIWLQPQWRNEEDVVTPSRVVVLVDTSLSMAEPASEATSADGSASIDGAKPAAPATGGPANDALPTDSRAAEIARLLQSPWTNELRRTHEIHVVGFDAVAARRLASLDRLPLDDRSGAGPPAVDVPDWSSSLAPRGGETRLGEAVGQALFDHRAAPVSGIVVLSDGGNNTGLDPVDAVRRAAAERLPVPPIFAIGLGSTAEVKNLRLHDVVAPARTYPTDEFDVKAYLQTQGMAGRTASVEMIWREAAGSAPGVGPGGELDRQTKSVTIPADGKPFAVDFRLKPKKLGRTTVEVRIKNPPADDRNKLDDAFDADVEVTERRNKVLLFASGATREYQFLRNQLQRILRADGSKDKEFVVDVYLQTGSDGISQDSSEILPDFPDRAEALFDYDCIVAFDPDWRRLSTAQMNLLKEWVADKAGGLIVVAGRIFTDTVARDPNLSIIRGLYPVEFGRLFAGAGDALSGNSEPWRVRFTDEGRRADFLRLDDGQPSGADVWDDFPGMYDYYPVKGAKDKAVVLAGLADPQLRDAAPGRLRDDARPYLIVEHAVGAGRVLYLGSGELWRLRALDASHFTRLYTQLVRHAAQARLLRGSKRGLLMIDHDNGRYVVNEVAEVRAQLTDVQAKPLKAADVTLQITGPDPARTTLKLTADPALPGNFRGLFPLRVPGAYRLDLLLPDGDQELLTRRLQVRVPNKESDDVRLHEIVLRGLADETGGAYFAGVDAAVSRSDPARSLAARLADKTRVTPRLAKPVSLWDNEWTLAGVCSVLCLEWLIRRLAKLA